VSFLTISSAGVHIGRRTGPGTGLVIRCLALCKLEETALSVNADPVAADVTLEQIHRLRAAFTPVEGASQVIHGDLGGNVLVSDDGGPVVIDWPPYFRPPGFALAVAVGDAVRWEDVPVAFIDAWRDVADWYQLLARALVYRLATAGIQQQDGRANLSPEEHAATSEPAVALVLDRLFGRQR